ncbi:MAG: hypothetical protein OEX12_00285 [Gammaproteobacteria bacterium]|nr:hypothetical protein [Gammaproteobacteria bacterium]
MFQFIVHKLLALTAVVIMFSQGFSAFQAGLEIGFSEIDRLDWLFLAISAVMISAMSEPPKKGGVEGEPPKKGGVEGKPNE